LASIEAFQIHKVLLPSLYGHIQAKCGHVAFGETLGQIQIQACERWQVTSEAEIDEKIKDTIV